MASMDARQARDAGQDRRVLAAIFAALRGDVAELADRTAALGEPAVTVVARRHRLTPLLSATCRQTLPAALAETWRRDHIVTAARNLALAGVAEECVAALAAAGIQGVLLKGVAYERTLYAGHGARPTNDIDLLVRDADRRAAFSVLDRLGFEPKAAAPGFDDADYHEVSWRRGPVEIDLHLALAPYARCAIDYADVWRSVQPLELGAARAFVLAPVHAAVFHALHMTIDHFDVPGLYLVDLARLVPTEADGAAVRETARAWRCLRPWQTSAALASSFQPEWPAGRALGVPPRRAALVADSFGGVARLPRPRQLARKMSHFDTAGDALRYTYVQGRRHLHELVERRVRRRTPRARLGL
jgi:hypothetical protein